MIAQETQAAPFPARVCPLCKKGLRSPAIHRLGSAGLFFLSCERQKKGKPLLVCERLRLLGAVSSGNGTYLNQAPCDENHSHAQPHLGVLCTARLASPSPQLIIPTARDCHPRRTLRAAPRHDGITAGAWYSWAQAGRSSIQVCCRAFFEKTPD